MLPATCTPSPRLTHPSCAAGPTFNQVRSSGSRVGPDGKALKVDASRGEARAWIGISGPAGERPSTASLRNPGVIDREENMFFFATRLLELLEEALLAQRADAPKPKL